MQISEFSFPHLRAAHDERLAIELERQRVAAERVAESAGSDGHHEARHGRALAQHFRRPERRIIGTRAIEAQQPCA